MMITRVDVEAARELVIVAVYAKRDSDGSILPEIVERIDDLAAAESCVSIRFHTIRPALARVMSKRYGYRLAEVVMRKDLSDV
ncbi:hypothetical protein [Synoicihabitans lomoniglobus]|uniref:Uncharacterized protein n=1 Tax=Synoicihabitans lomoniglobus TaxID=2909285 RepID=A0AAF0CRS0_9BACT|nr:hypothetical protein [Opitutaceae bacterium LMO-M01]WED66850.1 hypothetical protein PXH66_08305 [Opitutaceae bacterium LMO-M01]